MGIIKEIQAEKLNVKVFETRKEMGEASSREMSMELKKLLQKKDEVNIVFAAAPSQNEFLELLRETEGIEWSRVNAFHMDEYLNLASDAPQSFGNFLKDRIFNRVGFKSVNILNGNATDPEQECIRYANLLKKYPPDIVCMGIGENGHIAFNDPHVADFNDDKSVKIVELDEKCRIQQVNDGCFRNLEEVPVKALTLTIPTLISAETLFCIVPGQTKAVAVKAAIMGEINESCPASIIRTHKKVSMYIDRDSATEIL